MLHPAAMARAGSDGQLAIDDSVAAALRRGHPWVFRDARWGGASFGAGAVVDLVGRDGAFVARGTWDPVAPIAVRVFTRDAAQRLDLDLVAVRVERALERRDRFLADPATNAYRLLHGEGDRVPGLVLDRYDHVVVARPDGAAMDAWLERVAARIWPLLVARGVRTLARRVPRDGQSGGASMLEPLQGEPAPDSIEVLESGVRTWVDLARGQKTGAFLDQRDNRVRVRGLARGRRVLNLYSYAGGFSIAAVLGGSGRVTSVDVAHAAHATAQRTFRANGVDPTPHAWVTADALAFLDGARARGEQWDLVICDPPSFAPSEKAKPRALTTYRRLHAACAAVLAPGGTLCAASCSSHVGPDEFLATLDDASLGRADLSVVASFGPPVDHPVVAGWPEGRYLKFVVLG